MSLASHDTAEPDKIARGFIAAAIVVLCWSGFNIVSRLAGKSALTPFDLGALRFSVAGLIMLPLFIRELRRVDRRKFLHYCAVTFFGGLSYALSCYMGFFYAPAAHAGVLVNGGIPFATAIIAWLILGQRPHGRALFALLVALAGIALMGVQSFTHSVAGSKLWIGDLLFLYAALSWAIAGLLMRRWQLKPIDTTAMMVGLGAVVYLPIYFLFLPKAMHLVSTGTLIFQGFYQGIVAATMAGIFYNYANHTIGPHKASLMLALVPGVTAIAAVPFLGEALTPITIIGVALVTIGAVLGTLPRSRS